MTAIVNPLAKGSALAVLVMFRLDALRELGSAWF
jgi:hypothetical protein